MVANYHDKQKKYQNPAYCFFSQSLLCLNLLSLPHKDKLLSVIDQLECSVCFVCSVIIITDHFFLPYVFNPIFNLLPHTRMCEQGLCDQGWYPFIYI